MNRTQNYTHTQKLVYHGIVSSYRYISVRIIVMLQPAMSDTDARTLNYTHTVIPSTLPLPGGIYVNGGQGIQLGTVHWHAVEYIYSLQEEASVVSKICGRTSIHSNDIAIAKRMLALRQQPTVRKRKIHVRHSV